VRVLHTYPFLGAEKGGIAACVPDLLKECCRQGVEADLVSQSWNGDDPLGAFPSDITFRAVRTKDTSGFGYSRKLRKVLKERAIQSDVIHSHGLWMYMDYLSSRTASSFGRPHVISAHGSFEPWALARSAWKKNLVRFLFADRSLERAACLHALCRPEAENIRALGYKSPIAVIPNGIDPADFMELPPKGTLAEKFPQLEGCKLILFLSRIHPKKGLLHLAAAWGTLAERFPEWHLVVAGPDEVGHRTEIEKALAAHGVAHRTTLTGMVTGRCKLAVLASADVFVLPSFSEGFSMAVLEAMACGLPVLLTPGCNFPEAVAAGAALEIEPDVQSTAAGLQQLMEMTNHQRQEMGERGRELVNSRYTWSRVARKMIELYKWCLGSGEPPPTVWLG
jgi:glycosyltransferase involved in cell wall biosynthesis